MSNKYILDGHTPVPIEDVLEWGNWFETADRIVKQEEVNGHAVSTVFIGLDHQLGEGEPLLFETMIFKINEGVVDYMDLYCDRYTTWEQAEEGHKKAVEHSKSL